MAQRELRIHGDNIVECERALTLLGESQDATPRLLPGSALVPKFQITSPEGRQLEVQLFPGFGRWKQDVIAGLANRGAVLREAPDVLITRVAADRTFEDPLLAIEFCSALDAGNQAWQRSGRAYSIGAARIPYFYVTELGGFELDGDRRRKAARFPNPAVPFSYVAAFARSEVLSLPVFEPNLAAQVSADPDFEDCFGIELLVEAVAEILDGDTDGPATSGLLSRAELLVEVLAGKRGRNNSLPPEAWRDILDALRAGVPLVDRLLASGCMPWSKTAYISALTDSAAELMERTSQIACGLTSSNLPFCVIPDERRPRFREILEDLYPTLSEPFLHWVAGKGHLAIAWIMGFKPGGDDARPDRGLVPLLKMLAGEKVPVLSVVYGPAKPGTWALLEHTPRLLAKQNGLWQAILNLSDALLTDAATDTSAPVRGYTSGHFGHASQKKGELPPLPYVPPNPTRLSEHDVDTAIHILFSRACQDDYFEGMCNPPGGDWSGFSLMAADGCSSMRWISLPRVTRPGTKRPDHIVQSRAHGIVLAIESKESLKQLRKGIGPALVAYVHDLLFHPPTVTRVVPKGEWVFGENPVERGSLLVASAGAYVGAFFPDDASALECDILFALPRAQPKEHTILLARALTDLGKRALSLAIAASKNHETVRLRAT